jgi:hypothetical protein
MGVTYLLLLVVVVGNITWLYLPNYINIKIIKQKKKQWSRNAYGKLHL